MAYSDYYSLPMEPTAIVIVSAVIGISGIGVAIAYFVGDPRSPATRALAFAVAMVGIANALYPAQHVLHPSGVGTWWLVGLPILDALVMCGLFLWMLRVARAAQPSKRALRWVHFCAGLFALVTCVYLILGAMYPVERMSRFLFCLGHAEGCSGSYFWIFAIPVSLMGSLLVLAGIIVYRQRVDAAERDRVVCVALATPFFFANYILPAGYNVFPSLPGLFIFMIGGVRYHTIQGERGQLLSRFLSREVATQVAIRGLTFTMQPQKLEVTGICLDLRGFTYFSGEHDSAEVTRLLNEYYEAVGKVAARYQATILSYQGDGILIVVGAPIAQADHASQGLKLARDAVAASEEVTASWSTAQISLSVGAGVASGVVTAGGVGSSARMEYTAIGPAINLASRLCAIAGNGQILVATQTAAQVGEINLVVCQPVQLKGLGMVPHYTYADLPDRTLAAAS